MDTILAEVGHPNELYESDKCEDVSIEEFYQVVSVKFVPTGSDWFETGNMPYVNQLNKNEDPSRFLYYQKRFVKGYRSFFGDIFFWAFSRFLKILLNNVITVNNFMVSFQTVDTVRKLLDFMMRNPSHPGKFFLNFCFELKS